MRLEINWWHGYGNSPEFVVHADDTEVPKFDSFLWGLYPLEGYDYLISTNNDPWIKYVAVDRKHRHSDPTMGGALGGDYRLTLASATEIDKPIYYTRTGWSSRASVINKYFRDKMPPGSGGLISEVVVKTLQGGNWGGFNLTKTKLDKLVADYNANRGPESAIYITVYEHSNGEISLTPSIYPDRVEKPQA